MTSNKSKLAGLPKETLADAKRVFLEGTEEEIDKLRRSLGYPRRDTFYRAMRGLGLERTFDWETKEKARAKEVIPSLSKLEQNVINIVKKHPTSVGEISRQVDRSSETIIKTLDALREKHYMVELDAVSRLVELPAAPQKSFGATSFNYFRRYYKIGVVSDTHLGSKFQQITALYDMYKIFDSRDVDFIVHAGDLVDGFGMYREQVQETFLHTAPEQRDFTVEHYPRAARKDCKTYVIGGQHDRSWYKMNGYDILEDICEKRDDLVYRGFFSAQFEIKGLPIRLEHPGGGLAYARSYSAQKIVENMMGYINTIPTAVKPALLLMGHWHTPLLIPVYMGVNCVTLSCFQAQTPYMQQRKNMMPTIGGAIIEVWLNENNELSSIKPDFVIMNDQIKEKDW